MDKLNMDIYEKKRVENAMVNKKVKLRVNSIVELLEDR
jgi:hypothetical protein